MSAAVEPYLSLGAEEDSAQGSEETVQVPIGLNNNCKPQHMSCTFPYTEKSWTRHAACAKRRRSRVRVLSLTAASHTEFGRLGLCAHLGFCDIEESNSVVFCTYAKPFLISFAEAISEHEMALNYNRVIIPAPVSALFSLLIFVVTCRVVMGALMW